MLCAIGAPKPRPTFTIYPRLQLDTPTAGCWGDCVLKRRVKKSTTSGTSGRSETWRLRRPHLWDLDLQASLFCTVVGTVSTVDHRVYLIESRNGVWNMIKLFNFLLCVKVPCENSWPTSSSEVLTSFERCPCMPMQRLLCRDPVHHEFLLSNEIWNDMKRDSIPVLSPRSVLFWLEQLNSDLCSWNWELQCQNVTTTFLREKAASRCASSRLCAKAQRSPLWQVSTSGFQDMKKSNCTMLASSQFFGISQGKC